MQARFVLRHPALTMVGILLFCILAFLMLGWAVSAQQAWLHKIGEENYDRLFYAYRDIAAAMLPGDLDHDGQCDGLEYFLHYDPRDPLKHSEVIGRWDSDGFCAYVGAYQGDGMVAFDEMEKTLLPNAEEPLRLHGHLLADPYTPATFPKGFQLRLTPPPGYLLAPPGGTLSAASLVIPVAHDGSIAFDLQAAPETVNDPKGFAQLHIDNAVTGQSLFGWMNLELQRCWDLAPVIPTVTVERDATPPVERDDIEYHLDWPPITTSPDILLVQVARDETGASWHPIASFVPQTESCTVHQYRSNPADPIRFLRALPFNYSGPLKFRVLPVCFSKPQ